VELAGVAIYDLLWEGANRVLYGPDYLIARVCSPQLGGAWSFFWQKALLKTEKGFSICANPGDFRL
jgi:hypothetical protein